MTKLIGTSHSYENTSFCLFLAQQTPVGHGLLFHEVSRSHTTTQHSQQDSSGRVISSSQRPLPDNIQHSTIDKHLCPRWDSNPQPQQASGHRPTPQTARPLGPAPEFKLHLARSNICTCCVSLLCLLIVIWLRVLKNGGHLYTECPRRKGQSSGECSLC